MRAVVALLAPALLAGCHTLGCTEIGCSGTLTVRVGGVAAEQVVDLDLGDGTAVSCVVPVSGSLACTGDGSAVLVVDGESASVTVQTSMTEAPPESVDVVVRDGDTVLLDGQATPAWTGPQYPNGAACDAPVGCWSGDAGIDVP